MTGQRMVDDIFDWTHDKLSGRVHTVNTDVRCFISEDRERLESPELVSSESTAYEAGGKRRIRVLVFKDSKSVYQYDTAGHQIKSVTTEPDGQFRDREISTFDVDGRLVSTLLEFHDGEKVTPHFAYSSVGGRRVNVGRQASPKCIHFFNLLTDIRTWDKSTYSRSGQCCYPPSSERTFLGDSAVYRTDVRTY